MTALLEYLTVRSFWYGSWLGTEKNWLGLCPTSSYPLGYTTVYSYCGQADRAHALVWRFFLFCIWVGKNKAV